MADDLHHVRWRHFAFFRHHRWLGQPLRLVVAIMMAYVIGTHHVPDLKQILRRVLVYLLIAIVIVGFYVSGFLLLEATFGNDPKISIRCLRGHSLRCCLHWSLRRYWL